MKRVVYIYLPIIALCTFFLASGCRQVVSRAENPTAPPPIATANVTSTTAAGGPVSAVVATATPFTPATGAPLPKPTASATASSTATVAPVATTIPSPSPSPTITPTPLHPLSIAALRKGNYPGSELVIEETLSPGAGYDRYIASYESEGYRQYGLLTIPGGEQPESGWPAIILNHGYIPSYEYNTSETYKAHAEAFARHQYVVFVPDYRGHANSEGEATAAYGAPDYTIDVLNALASVKQHPAVDPERIGMFGHSLGGYITLRVMVARDDVRAGVIWAGVVSPYADFYYSLERRFANSPTPTPGSGQLVPGRWWQRLAAEHGTPAENPAFWDSISATSFLEDISGPLQLQHGTADEVVPFLFSENLKEQMDDLHRYASLHLYEGDDHNFSYSFTPAMVQSIGFFDRFVKGTGN